MTTGDDPWEVFVCHVPPDTRSTVLRRPAAAAVVRRRHTWRQFSTPRSAPTSTRCRTARTAHGSRAGGEVTIAAADEPQACVDKALAAASDSAHGVIAIADAEHNADAARRLRQPWQRVRRATVHCFGDPAIGVRRRGRLRTRNGVIEPPMDLVEHEIGHALGWPHSGYDESQSEPNRSALDRDEQQRRAA